MGPIQHKDARPRRAFAQRHGFFQARDKKTIAAGRGQRGHDGVRAQAVSIGFDHRGHGGGTGHAAIGSVVGGNGGQTHGQARGFEI